MGFLDFLEQREQRKKEESNRAEYERNRWRVYNDVAVILWYEIARSDVLKHKAEHMDNQQEPFRVGIVGNRSLVYGPIKALTSSEDIERFEKTARAVLKDRGFGKFKVKAFPNAIVVTC